MGETTSATGVGTGSGTARRRFGIIDSPVGELLAVAEAGALGGLYFTPHQYPPAPESIGPQVSVAEDKVLAATAEELGEYFAGQRTHFSIAVSTDGDAFSESVWQLLREIPYGDTWTYADLAVRLGNKHLAQRVGQSVGHNPISIIVPCHRVIGADGSLTGFAGGLDRKRYLLSLEEPAPEAAGRLF